MVKGIRREHSEAFEEKMTLVMRAGDKTLTKEVQPPFPDRQEKHG